MKINDLQQAINACGDTDTIKILAGIKCSEPLTIEEGKTVTIDLMGNNIEANFLLDQNGTTLKVFNEIR